MLQQRLFSHAVVLAGGTMTVTAELLSLLQTVGFVVAADSGLRHAKALALVPDVIVGDFDSVEASLLADYPDIPREQHPPEKDWLDLELAIHLVLNRVPDVQMITIVGGFGSRLDQSLAALLIATRYAKQGVHIQFHSGLQQGYVMTAGEVLELPLAVGQTFSLLSLELAVVSVSNVKYPLNKARLEVGVGLGVSNVVTQLPLQVSVDEGLVTLLVEDSANL